MAPEDLRKWIRLMDRAEATAAGAGARLVSESRIRELEQELGRQRSRSAIRHPA